MLNGNEKFEKFDMFADLNEAPESGLDSFGEEEVEIISITPKADSKKKFTSAPVARTQEEYDECVESFYFETHYHPETNEPYEVKVTVLKPEVNPMELLRPAYAYATSHS